MLLHRIHQVKICLISSNLISEKSTLKREISTKSSGTWDITDADNIKPSKVAKLSNWNVEEIVKKEESAEVPAKQEGRSDKIVLRSEISDLSKLSKKWQENQNFKNSCIEFMNDPFKIGVLNGFIDDPEDVILENLVDDMTKIDWNRKQMDLYDFYQSQDLANIDSPHLSKFYKFLTTDFKEWMQEFTGMKFRHVSATCSNYNFSDHLLIHDDLLGDRLIAYVFYVSPWVKDWSENNMGGALEVYKTDEKGLPRFPVYKKIPPKNNQMTFFKVCKKSFHSVEEVFSMTYPRLTVHGWLHGFSDNSDYDEDAVKLKNVPKPNYKPSNPKIKIKNIKEFISADYLKGDVKKHIQQEIEEKSEIALEEFFESDLFDKVWAELKRDNLEWQVKNPANQQFYEILKIESVAEGILSSFLEFFSSQEMFKYLYEVTELDFHGKNSKSPKFTMEIQRWKGGCYSLIGDKSTFNESTLDLTLFFGNNDNVGKITYLNPEGQEAEEEIEEEESASELEEIDPVLLTIYPRPNVLNIVYRSEGTTKFTKYCSKKTVMEKDSEYNYLMVCSYKE